MLIASETHADISPNLPRPQHQPRKNSANVGWCSWTPRVGQPNTDFHRAGVGIQSTYNSWRVIPESMPKTLSDRIGESALRLKSVRRNRAVFLAYRADILQALDDGWSKKAVWKQLRSEGAITFGYDAFLSYTRQALRARPSTAVTARSKNSAPPPMQGFEFSATPKKEDLV